MMSATAFGNRSRAVTPGSSDLNVPCYVVCLTTGNITVVPEKNADDATVAFEGVAAGYVVPFKVRRVTAATATVATIE